MNKLPTSPRLRRTGITFLCFSAVILGATSHAMDVEPLGKKYKTDLDEKLLNAVRMGFYRPIEKLLAQGAPINAKDNNGWTPLMFAARAGHEQICKLLIENKATIDAKDNYGNTPLMRAARDGREQTCKLLIENKATIDAKDNYGWTPLMFAARDGREQTCKLLIENKATIDAKDNYGRTPLMWAARNGHEQICKLLIENKASIDAKDNDGRIPLMWAASWDHEQVCKLLIDALLAPVKEKQAVAIALLGIKKYRNIPGFRHIDREVIRLIVRPAYECAKRQLFAQINMIKNENFKQRLLDYAKQQLHMQNGETSHE